MNIHSFEKNFNDILIDIQFQMIRLEYLQKKWKKFKVIY